jgi:4-hydroxy-tetrahydrodipicolinate synthase
MTTASLSPIRGVLAAALTPMTADLSPDPKATIAHYKWLLARGCDGIASLGTTGEANSFSVEERLDIIAAIGESDLPKDRLMVGTGTCAEPDTVRLTRAALDAGIPYVLVLPPFYYKGVSDDGLATAFGRVIDAVADSRLRVCLYHFPKMTGVPVTAGVIERLRKRYPEVVVGLKDSSGDLDNMKALLDAFPGFGVFAGTERYLLPVLQGGGPGCISASVNITSPQAADVFRAFEAGSRDAGDLQARLTAVRQVFDGVPLVAALKETMAVISGREGWRAMRPPLMPLGREAADELRRRLAAAGLELKSAA